MSAPRLVVCAANRNVYGDVILGARHFDEHMRAAIMNLPTTRQGCDWEQGFIDQRGIFMGRIEALRVATEAGQINTWRPKTQPETLLFSEDIY